jgi:hypothetical protein
MTKISWLMLLREIIAVRSQKHTKSINTTCEQNSELFDVKVGSAYAHTNLKMCFRVLNKTCGSLKEVSF